MSSATKTTIGSIIVVILIIGGIALFKSKGATTTNNPSACVNKTIAASANGTCVSDLQTMLNWSLYGIDQPNYQKITGSFSTETKTEVKQFQSQNSLSQTGTVTTTTWQKLCGFNNDPPAAWTTAAKNAGCLL